MSETRTSTLLALTPKYETRRTTVTVGALYTVNINDRAADNFGRMLSSLQKKQQGSAAPLAVALNCQLDHYLEQDDAHERDELLTLFRDTGAALNEFGVSEVFLHFETTAGTSATNRIRHADDRFHRMVHLLGSIRYDYAMLAIRIHIGLAAHGFPATPRELRQCIDEANSPWIVATAPPVDSAGAMSTEFFHFLGHRIASLRFADAEQARQALTPSDADTPNAMLRACTTHHRPLLILEEGPASEPLLRQLEALDCIYAHSSKIDPRAAGS